MEPASQDDERVAFVAHHVVCRHALAAPDAWQLQRRWFEMELAWILDPDEWTGTTWRHRGQRGACTIAGQKSLWDD